MAGIPTAQTPGPGWYPDPAGSGRLQWWDGSGWTGQYGGPPLPVPAPAPGSVPGRPLPRLPRPRLGDDVPVYNPYIWIITALPLIPLLFLMLWNPVLRVRPAGPGQVRELDPTSVFTPPYFLLIGSGLLIYVVGALLAYLDWDKLRSEGVVRPFHWAWAFLSRELYAVGRSVVVHEVAPKRGLAPIWAVVGVTTLSIAVAGFTASALVSGIASQMQGF